MECIEELKVDKSVSKALVNDKNTELPTADPELSLEENSETCTLSSEMSNSSLKDLKDEFSQNTEEDVSENLDIPPNKSDLKLETDASGVQKSPLIKHKDSRESSPFKEAIRGYVLSKLTKKPNDPDSVNMSESERKTLFSGIKERIVKKLEEGAVKDVNGTKEEFVNGEDGTSSLINAKRSEQELKSMVANDQMPVNIDEAEECFEDIKKGVNSADDIFYDYPPPSLSPSEQFPKAAPRSKTMSNIVGSTHQKLKPRVMSDKNLSMLFSSLQKSELDKEDDISDNFSQTEASVQEEEEEDSSENLLDNSSGNGTNLLNEKQSLKSRVSIALKGHFQRSIWMDVLIIVISVIIFFCFYKQPFFSGVLFGILIVSLAWLIYSEIANILLSSNDQRPVTAYKKLPPLTMPVAKHRQTLEHKGWMNQLFGEYNPKIHKLTDTISVYVRIRDDKMFLSYPKKNVPRRSMWNEKPLYTHTNTTEEQYSLGGAKIKLLPPGVADIRTWNKKFPFSITLEKQEELRPRATSLDSGTLHLTKESELSGRTSKSQVQSVSLNNTPVHTPLNQNTFIFFTRTDREKEEWYWKFYVATNWYKACGILKDSNEPSFSLLNILEVDSAISSPSTSKNEEPKNSNSMPKPALDFDCYMYYLIKQQLNDIRAFESECNVHWLNVFLGRLFYDFLSRKEWANSVMDRIQLKLDKLKMPPYMEKLVVTDVYLGTSLPHIHRASDAVQDGRGLWIDFNIKYKGYFQMTLETKLKSLKWIHEKGQVDDLLAPEIGTEAIPEELNDDWDEDEDIGDSEASKEESPVHSLPQSAKTKLLQSLEKWVVSSNITENSFVKRCVEQLTQARLVLTVEISHLHGTLAINFPPLPTNRLWYGFRTNPELLLNVFPKVGEHHISLIPVVQLIKRKLLMEFQRALVMPNMDDLIIPLMHSVFDEE